MMLTLYHHPASVSAAKVRLVSAEKHIGWESKIVDLYRGEQFATSYLALNPAAVVPTLVADGRIVRESVVICEYLEEAFPKPSLVPADFAARARMRVWCKDIETFMSVSLAGAIFPASDRFEIAKLSAADLAAYYDRHPNKKLAERKRVWADHGYAAPEARSAVLTYHKFLQKLDMQLAKSRWLIGDSFTLADLETAPYIAILELLNFQGWWKGRLPRIDAWYESVKARPSFRPAVIDPLPEQLKNDMAARGAAAWPAIGAILATAEPFNGKSPWAMRAEAL